MLIYVLIITTFLAIFIDENESLVLLIIGFIFMSIANIYFLYKIFALIFSSLISELQEKLAIWEKNAKTKNSIIFKILSCFKKKKTK